MGDCHLVPLVSEAADSAALPLLLNSTAAAVQTLLIKSSFAWDFPKETEFSAGDFVEAIFRFEFL